MLEMESVGNGNVLCEYNFNQKYIEWNEKNAQNIYNRIIIIWRKAIAFATDGHIWIEQYAFIWNLSANIPFKFCAMQPITNKSTICERKSISNVLRPYGANDKE